MRILVPDVSAGQSPHQRIPYRTKSTLPARRSTICTRIPIHRQFRVFNHSSIFGGSGRKCTLNQRLKVILYVLTMVNFISEQSEVSFFLIHLLDSVLQQSIGSMEWGPGLGSVRNLKTTASCAHSINHHKHVHLLSSCLLTLVKLEPHCLRTNEGNVN